MIKVQSGMIIRRNRIHLRKRFIDCDFTSHFTADPIATEFNSATDSTTVTSNIPQNVALPGNSNRERRPPRRFNEYVMYEILCAFLLVTVIVHRICFGKGDAI